ncbi:hypothetical protein L596_011190 [Steinernema carpocapsae]|uniref:Peroxisomal ATPase PEX6 n=1 Tax=Steinernema carpocapsae TaxID=34508 RepID=A0A4U5NTX4_STECR|nr:hypothetical protein L596_011190 [Steinernema carpocapsae]
MASKSFRRSRALCYLLACRYLLRILHRKLQNFQTLQNRFRFPQQLQILPSQISSSFNTKIDVNRHLFLSASLAILHDVRPQSLYSIRFVDSDGKRCVERVFRVTLLDPAEFPGICGVFLTPEAAFNTFCGEESSASIGDIGLFKIKSHHLASRIPQIESVSVSQILSTKYPSYVDYGFLLEEYFALPRIISNNDVFSISVDTFSDSGDDRIFYKIKLNGVQNADGVFETNSRTSFFQLTSAASKFPVRHVPDALAIPSAISSISSKIVRLVDGYLKTDVESHLCLLVTGAGGSGKKLAIARATELLGFNLIKVSCYDMWSDVSGNSETKIDNFFKNAAKLAPCVCVFKDMSVLGHDQNSNEIDERVMSCFNKQLSAAPRDLTIVFTSDPMEAAHLAASVHALVTYEMKIPDLTEHDRLEWLRSSSLKHLNISRVAKNTAGFVISELRQMAFDCSQSAFCDDRSDRIQLKDVDRAIEARNKLFADSVGAPQIPHVAWSEVGGLEETKRLICESLQMNLEGNEKALKRTGIVLYGPPGCGKTLLAKAVASQFNITFLSVKGPEMLNKYIGQSEENIRNLFERARMASPCVIFFDELDALAPNRGRSGDSGGVMDRVVSQLLSELDSLHAKPNCNVFVMAATNRSDLLDQSLLTPGDSTKPFM